MKTNLYVSFFHGRVKPDTEMDGWGFQGPVVGPVAVSWTYTCVKLHDTSWDDLYHLPIVDGCIKIGKSLYGDFEVWTEDDPLLSDAKKEGRPLITFEQLVEIQS